MSQEALGFKSEERVEEDVMEADGSNLRRLTNREGTDGSPTWLPGGRYIAFQSDRDIETLQSAATCRMADDRLEIDGAAGDTLLVFEREE